MKNHICSIIQKAVCGLMPYSNYVIDENYINLLKLFKNNVQVVSALNDI